MAPAIAIPVTSPNGSELCKSTTSKAVRILVDAMKHAEVQNI
jgi:hypothetical protein